VGDGDGIHQLYVKAFVFTSITAEDMIRHFLTHFSDLESQGVADR